MINACPSFRPPITRNSIYNHNKTSNLKETGFLLSQSNKDNYLTFFCLTVAIYIKTAFIVHKNGFDGFPRAFGPWLGRIAAT